MKIIVYRGSEYHEEARGKQPTFFSTSPDFAKDYGEVAMYQLNLSKPFDTISKEHIDLLLKKVKEVTDEYSGDVFTSYEEIEGSGLLAHDTWEMFEPFMNQIESFGFDSMIIYEGGIQNFVTFQSNSYLRIESSIIT